MTTTAYSSSPARTEVWFWLLLCFVATPLSINGFVMIKPSSHQLQQHRSLAEATGGIHSGSCTSRRNMIPLDQMTADLISTATSSSSIDVVLAAQQHSLVSSSWLLAAAADAATAATTAETSWWDSFVNVFEVALKFVHSTIDGPLRSAGVEQTWGVSIILFTAMIRSALLPLSIQQSKSAEYMKALKPYVADIKVKFKGNENAITRATGKLYEDAKQNPLAGCFVSLAQLPVFLGLYRGVRMLAIDDQLNEPFLWIPSLEGPVTAPDYQGLDWLIKGWTTATVDGGFPFVPPMGWETTTAFLIMPVVLVLLQSVTMKVLQPPVDEYMTDEEKKQIESTQQVFRFLPLLIGVFSLQVPAGLTLYWFTSNIFTLSQSLGVRAYFAANPPKVELPDYWDTALTGDGKDMTPEERRRASEAGISVGPSFTDLVDEAKFHCFVERKPLRLQSAAWQRIETTSPIQIENLPTSLQDWVKSGPPATTSTSSSSTSSTTTHQSAEATTSEAMAVAESSP